MGIILLVTAAIGLALILLAAQKRWVRLRNVAGGLLVSYVTVLLLLGLAEGFFRYVYAESENVMTLATQNWLDRYWHTNSLGFRDREWTAADWDGKTTVVVTGDSFAAGWGLEDPADRFTDVLARRLGDEYAVINLGLYGTATSEQLDLLRNYPLTNPDVVIMQYFLNDINYAGLRLGLLPDPGSSPSWARESYLGNYLYARLIRGSRLDPVPSRDWWQWSYDAYDNVTIWNLHRQEIEDYIAYVESVSARLIVVIFPNMLDPVRSIAYVDRVAMVFEEHGHHDILKLFDAVAAWDPHDLMVSPRDAHPSISFHRYVADQLYERFFAPSGNA